ncbi:MAG: MATE family efflux transporter [Clostridia bacterium]|nr:MATE family efflux transporter [Clostridia bacterium]
MKRSSLTLDMCTGSIFKKMLRFALPLMLSGVLQLLFNAADVIVVGQFAGTNSLAAVGSTTALIALLTNLFIGLSVGVNVLAARYFGAGQEREFRQTIHTSVAIGALSGVFLTVLGMVLARPILEMMGTPAEVIDLSVLYLRTYFAGMAATMLYNFTSTILLASGDTIRPLIILSCAGALNVSFNLLFVICFQWGVFGVGLATAISQWASSIAVVVCLLVEKGPLKLCLREIKIHKDKLLKILRIGLPAGLQSSLFSIANVVIQSSVNGFGPLVMAGNTAAQNLESFVFVSMSAFSQAAVSFIGQNLGAGRHERINRIVGTAQGCVIGVNAIIGVILFTCGPFLLSLYNSEPDVIAAGMDRLRIMAVSFVLAGMMDVMVGSLRGLGYSVMPMIVSLIGVCALRLVWIFTLFQMPMFHSVEMLYITYPISWGLTLVAHTTCFAVVRKRLKRKWGV